MYIPLELVTFVAGVVAGGTAVFGFFWYISKKANNGGDKV